MVNILIADDNIYFATTLMNYINDNNDNIRVCSIALDGYSTLNVLQNKNNIDIFLLDLIMPKYNGYQVLEQIKNDKRYKKSCIVISGCIENFHNLISNPVVYTVISKSNTPDEYMAVINKLVTDKNKLKQEKLLQNKILHELQYLGYDISHKGTKYLLSAILFIIIHHNSELNNLEKDVYKILSHHYKQSIHNIKCSINRATTFMYNECEINKLKSYFNFCNDTKPKIKTIISTIINKIQI